jgi:hypothetical protein
MILAEELVLLSLDSDRGRIANGIAKRALLRGAAGAILAEMVLRKRINAVPGGLTLADSLPDFHPLLSEAGRLLARERGAIPEAVAIQRVAHGISGLLRRLLRSLVARDILHDEREAFFVHRYPVRSMQALREVFARVHAVVAGQGGHPELALAACAEASGVLAVRFTAEERFRVRRQIETRREQAASGDMESRLILSLAAAIAPDRGH